jgi:Pregnancy-associated plasma protein-A/Secretion system C-terminal sorting domain
MKKAALYPLYFMLYTIACVSNAQEKCGLESQAQLHTIDLYSAEFTTAYESFYREHLQNPSRASTKLYIPVHFIIVSPVNSPIGSSQNPSNGRILSQLNAMNRDFLRLNADTINTPDIFSTGNPNIEFCMATTDPVGMPTDGITRYATNKDFQADEMAIKGITGWPRKDYLNVWVANISNLGFSYIATTTTLPNSILDGVTIDYQVFGGPGTGAKYPFDLGRTATHELGHFLGLRHIWSNNGCTGDDGISDTPIQNTSNSGCKIHPSPSCGNDGDMFMNYMDYSDDACLNAFTYEQSLYMRSILQGIRFSLLTSGKSMCDKEVATEETAAFKSQFSVYPNPFKDYLVLEYFGNKNEEVTIEIYDIFGKLIWEESQILLSSEKNIHNILANNIANSIFIFKIASKFKSTHFMIIKD